MPKVDKCPYCESENIVYGDLYGRVPIAFKPDRAKRFFFPLQSVKSFVCVDCLRITTKLEKPPAVRSKSKA